MLLQPPQFYIERRLMRETRAAAESARARLLRDEEAFVKNSLRRAIKSAGLAKEETLVAHASQCARTESTKPSHHGWWCRCHSCVMLLSLRIGEAHDTETDNITYSRNATRLTKVRPTFF